MKKKDVNNRLTTVNRYYFELVCFKKDVNNRLTQLTVTILIWFDNRFFQLHTVETQRQHSSLPKPNVFVLNIVF